MTGGATGDGVREPIGRLYAWAVGDDLPPLPPLVGFRAVRATKPEVLAEISRLPRDEVAGRLRAGHHLYLAELEEHAVGYGWSATRAAAIGELGLHLSLPPGNHYLWDFETLPDWRGHGVYTHLLRAVLEREAAGGTRCFWIGHDWTNTVSGRGIVRAGFRPVGTLGRLPDGRLVLFPSGTSERSAAGARLLGVPLVGAAR